MKRFLRLVFLLACLFTFPFAAIKVATAQDASATPEITLPAQVDTLAAIPQLSPTVVIAPSATPVPSQETPTNTPFPQSSVTNIPTVAATDTPRPPDGRPQLVVDEYHSSQEKVHAGEDFNLEISFRNNGTQPARGISIVFAADNFYVRETGGVWSRSELAPGESFTIRQPLTASWSLAGYTMAATQITASYTDPSGVAYNDTYSISVEIYFDSSWGNPTPTPVLGESPDILVQTYQVDVDTLKPGTTFSIQFTLVNQGSQLAKGVRVITGDSSGQSANSIAAGSVPFAVLDSSNLIYIGNISPGETRTLNQRLIADLKAAAGVYLLPLTFEYSNEKGQQFTNHQQVTLKIHTTPQLKISFYESPEELRVGENGSLPIQVTNMGYQAVMLGDLLLADNQSILGGDMTFIGPLESGSNFTHDVEINPTTSGELKVQVIVEYTDIYGSPQNVTQTLTAHVADGRSAPDPGTSDPQSEPVVEPVPQAEKFWQVLYHLLRGLLGLGG